MTDTYPPPRAGLEEIVQFASFYLDDTLCGINIRAVQEIHKDFRITQVPLSADYIMGIMNLRGQIVTIVNVGMKLGLARSVIGPDSRVVIVETKGEHVGLLVDKVIEVVEVSSKEITDPPANIKGVQGKFFEGVLHGTEHELMALLNVEIILESEH